MGSNPTPRAIISDSTTSLKYQNKENKNIQLKDASSVEISDRQKQQQQLEKDEVKEKIRLISKNQKDYIKKLLYIFATLPNNFLHNSLGKIEVVDGNQIKHYIVFDTYSTKKDGKIIHFDVIVNENTSNKTTLEYAKQYLKQIGQGDQKVTQEECLFCNIYAPTPFVENLIKEKGYYIEKMEGVP